MSFGWPHACWIAGVSGAVPIALLCSLEHVLRSNTCLSLASGRIVGNTSRLPNTTFGRPLHLPSRARTRSICVHTPEPGTATSCADVALHMTSRSHFWCSGRLCARGCGLPLLLTESTCECGAALDRCGRHRAACPRSGKLKYRPTAPERTLARVCREAGATVRTHVKLRDLNTTVERSIEVLASGLPMHRGAQLAMAITLRSAVKSYGAACSNASRVCGATLERVWQDKERKYHELLGGRCHLVVVGLETSGRWSDEALHFIETLASGRARDTAPVGDGSACCQFRAAAHSPLRCSLPAMTFGRTRMVSRPIWKICSGRFVETRSGVALR